MNDFLEMEKSIRYIAVDDSILDLLTLEEYAGKYPFLEKLGSFGTAGEALVAVRELKPDLVFMDIEMPGMSGIEVLKQIKQYIPLAVFITSHPEFALDGFELSALDYIVKPVTGERFAATAKRLKDYWVMKEKAAAYEVLFEQESLVIKEGHCQVKLPVHDIIYLEAMQDYTKVVTERKNYLTLTTFTGFLEKVSPQKFLRTHRSYAVARSKITRIAGNNLLCGQFAIPIGKTYRTEVNSIRL